MEDAELVGSECSTVAAALGGNRTVVNFIDVFIDCFLDTP